jgi:hypothetical protein
LITHATSPAARFLGYEIRTQHPDTKKTPGSAGRSTPRSACFVPREVIPNKCAAYMNRGKPAFWAPMLHDDDFTIVVKDPRGLPSMSPGHSRRTDYDLSPDVTTAGEPDVGKARLSGSGWGRRKRTHTMGTSPAAYFTLWGPGGEIPRATQH